MSNRIRCICGARLQPHRLIKNGLAVCPDCGEKIPCKRVQKSRRRNARIFKLHCFCGKRYRIPLPSGSFQFHCRSCGRGLFSVRPRELNGITLPRYIETAHTL